MGFDSILCTDYRTKEIDIDSDVAVFSEQGELEVNMMQRLKRNGVKLLRDHCENIFGFPYEHESFVLADKIVCCSTVLEMLTQKQGYQNTTVIKDAKEDNEPKVPIDYSRTKLSAVFSGSVGAWDLHKLKLEPILSCLGYKIVLITQSNDVGLRWEIDTWADIMGSCDVALCPANKDYPAKSNVRITAAMGLGLPVIATPQQSYKELIEDGYNGFLCDSAEEWFSALSYLRYPNNRKFIGEAGRAVVQKYSTENIAMQWWDLFKIL